MILDFPNTPAVGDLYPSPPVTGVPVYKWDGEKWIFADAGGSAVYVSDTVPVSAPDNSLWWESDTGQLYVYYNDGDSTQWVIACPQPDVSAFVRTDMAQSLTTTQRTQARENVYAAPFDALAYNGIQLNGSMDVSQEHGATVVTASGYVVDGWQVAGSAGFSTGQVADAPPGYAHSIKVTVTTPIPTLGVTDFLTVYQNIEGYRIQKLAFGTASAQPVSIGFWTKIHRPGMYSGSIRNGNVASRVYPFTFTQNAADTWEYKTVTIPGDVTGAWVGDNTAGFAVLFNLAVGTQYSAAANAWYATNMFGATGAINGAAAATDVFQITGVVVLPGIELPSASRVPLITRPYDQELLQCQRQWWCSNPATPKTATTGSLAGYTWGTTWVGYSNWFWPRMRAAPQLSIWNNGLNQLRNSSTAAVMPTGAVTGGYGSMLSGTSLIQFTTAVTASIWCDFDLIADARL